MASDAAGFPVTMKHPQHAPAVLSDAMVADSGGALAIAHGRPERFPDVTVYDQQQEEMYRAKGYLRFGESLPVYDAHLEYPKILCHEDFEEEVKPTQSPVVSPGGQVSFVTVPGKAARFPHVTVNSRQEEDKWAEKGYFPAGHFDVKAYEKAIDAPGDAGDEYPRAVYDDTGKFIGVQEDPDSPVDESKIYPMAIYEGDTYLGVAANAIEAIKLKTRGTTKNEPVVRKQVESSYDADYAEFLEYKRWKAQREQGHQDVAQSQAVNTEPSVGGGSEALPASEADDSIGALRKEAEDLGIKVHHRWNAQTLQREIDAALSR